MKKSPFARTQQLGRMRGLGDMPVYTDDDERQAYADYLDAVQRQVTERSPAADAAVAEALDLYGKIETQRSWLQLAAAYPGNDYSNALGFPDPYYIPGADTSGQDDYSYYQAPPTPPAPPVTLPTPAQTYIAQIGVGTGRDPGQGVVVSPPGALPVLATSGANPPVRIPEGSQQPIPIDPRPQYIPRPAADNNKLLIAGGVLGLLFLIGRK